MLNTEFSEEPMTPKDVAKKFFHGKVSYPRVLRMAKSGELPFLLINGRYLTWPGMLAEWFEKERKRVLEKAI